MGGAYFFTFSFMVYRIGLSFLNATGDSLLSSFMAKDNKQTVLARQNTASTAGRLVAPLVTGSMAKYHPSYVWPSAAFMSLITLAISGAVFSSQRKKYQESKRQFSERLLEGAEP